MVASDGTETTTRSGGKFEDERRGIAELYTPLRWGCIPHPRDRRLRSVDHWTGIHGGGGRR
jgi:hypothetical protein